MSVTEWGRESFREALMDMAQDLDARAQKIRELAAAVDSEEGTAWYPSAVANTASQAIRAYTRNTGTQIEYVLNTADRLVKEVAQ